MKHIVDIIHIWYEEFSDILKDKGILIFILFVPIMYPLLYSFVYTNELVRQVPIAVVDENKSHFSREFIRKMDACTEIRIMSFCNDMEEARHLLMQQKVYGILRIPKSFTWDLNHGDQTYVGVYSDMCVMLYYKALLISATNVSLEMNKDIKVRRYMNNTTTRQDEISRMPIKYAYVQLYNPQSGFATFLIPPVLMLIIQQTLLLGIGMSMGRAREKNDGQIIPFNKYYKNAVKIVLGKGLVYFMIYIIMAIYMYTYVSKDFGLPQLGHYDTFIAFIIPFILSCIFFAMVLSSFVYRREDCIMLFVFLSVPILFMSGVTWPGSNIPAFWKYVSYIFPTTFGINGYVRINNMGASLYEVADEYHALWLQTGIYFFIACLIYYTHIFKCVARIKKPIDIIEKI